MSIHDSNENWKYLGDGVYAHIDPKDPYPLVLCTGSHDAPDNIVYLEIPVIRSLLAFLKEKELT